MYGHAVNTLFRQINSKTMPTFQAAFLAWKLLSQKTWEYLIIYPYYQVLLPFSDAILSQSVMKKNSPVQAGQKRRILRIPSILTSKI